MIFLLQNFAYLKISPGSLNRIFKNLEFWVFHDILVIFVYFGLIFHNILYYFDPVSSFKYF